MVTALAKQLFAKFGKSSFVRESFTAVMVRGGGATLALAANFFLARALGPEVFGRYLYVFSWSIVLGGIATLGTPQLLVREIAADDSEVPEGKTINITRWALRLAALSTLFACTGLALFLWFSNPASRSDPRIVIIAALLVPLLSGIILAQAILRGKGRVIWGQSLMTVFRNVFLLIVAFSAFALGLLHGATVVLALQFIAIGLAFILGWLLVKRNAPMLIGSILKRAHSPTSESAYRSWKEERRKWLNSSLFFLFGTTGTAFMTQMDIVVVGWFGSERAVGLYGVAAKIGNMISLVGVAGLLVLQPRIVRALKTAKQNEVKRLMLRSAALFGIPSLLCVGVLALFGRPFLVLLLPNYVPAFPALMLIALSNTAYCITVPFLAYLSMTGREKQIAWIIWSQLALNIALNTFLVPLYGATGGGVSRALALTLGSLAILAIAMRSWGRDFPPLSGTRTNASGLEQTSSDRRCERTQPR